MCIIYVYLSNNLIFVTVMDIWFVVNSRMDEYWRRKKEELLSGASKVFCDIVKRKWIVCLTNGSEPHMERRQSLYMGTYFAQQSTNKINVKNGLVSSGLEEHLNLWPTLVYIVIYSSPRCRLSSWVSVNERKWKMDF